jgi:hypothetical protein
MTVSEVQQIGIEVTPGTAVVPTFQFGGLSVDIDTNIEFDEFKPAGQLTVSIVAPRREWSAGSLSGYPTYTELPYPISNVLGAATVTTPSGATLARRWLWEPSPTTPWVPLTWTLRRGVVGNTAEQAAYLALSGLEMSFSRTAAPTIAGDLFARALDYTAAVLATGVTSKALVPILPSTVCMFLDPTAATLGTTQLLRDFTFDWKMSALHDMTWPLDCTQPSFSSHTTMAPTIEATMQLGNDTQGRALVANMRAGSTVFVRLHADAAADSIEPGLRYSLQIDTALMCSAAPSRADMNGLSVLDWTFRNVYDATWGKWLSIAMVTNFAAL